MGFASSRAVAPLRSPLSFPRSHGRFALGFTMPGHDCDALAAALLCTCSPCRNALIEPACHGCHWAHGVVVSHPLSMREALGSIPSVSSCSSAVLLDLGGSFCLWRPVVISPTRCCCWLGAAWLAGAGSCSCKAVAALAVAACTQHQQLNEPRATAAHMCSDSSDSWCPCALTMGTWCSGITPA